MKCKSVLLTFILKFKKFSNSFGKLCIHSCTQILCFLLNYHTNFLKNNTYARLTSWNFVFAYSEKIWKSFQLLCSPLSYPSHILGYRADMHVDMHACSASLHCKDNSLCSGLKLRRDREEKLGSVPAYYSV